MNGLKFEAIKKYSTKSLVLDKETDFDSQILALFPSRPFKYYVSNSGWVGSENGNFC